jgi:hypothetical protein
MLNSSKTILINYTRIVILIRACPRTRPVLEQPHTLGASGTIRCARNGELAQEKIEALGGDLYNIVDERVHFLVTEDKKESGSAKIETAMEFGVPIIDEEKFLEFLIHPEKAQAEKTTERTSAYCLRSCQRSPQGLTPPGAAAPLAKIVKRRYI